MYTRFWRLQIIGAIAGFVLYLPFLYLKRFDLESIGYMLLLFLLIVAFGIGVFVRRAIVKRWISGDALLGALFFVAVSIAMFLSTTHLRPSARWIASSGRYKDLVLSQAPDPQTGLRSVEWDGWGWAGMDTSVELVYDPSDTLAHEIRYDPQGHFADVAQKTAFVQRLGRGWYSLTLYTGEVL